MYVKINGEIHCLWRAVDHEGEILESYVTKKRDKSEALRFLKKAPNRHGKAQDIVTDGLRSYPPPCANSAISIAARLGAGLTTGPRIRTCRSDDESGRCCGFAG